MTVQDWLRHKRRNEILLWVLFFVIQTGANIAVAWLDAGRTGAGYHLWAIAVWEISSMLVILGLVPIILLFDRHFPLRRGRWRRNALAHLVFSVIWSLVHVGGMVVLRQLAYSILGQSYDFGPWAAGLFYEYLKDFRTYFSLLALIYLYRFVIRRLLGEASFIQEGQEDREPEAPDRFLVKMLGKEFLVRVVDIDWIESAGNYVTLHVGRHEYMLRETMSSIEKRLAPCGFARVHRSAIVNLDRVAHIEPFDTGDARAQLTSGQVLPVSRRYRQGLKERLA